MLWTVCCFWRDSIHQQDLRILLACGVSLGEVFLYLFWKWLLNKPDVPSSVQVFYPSCSRVKQNILWWFFNIVCPGHFSPPPPISQCRWNRECKFPKLREADEKCWFKIVEMESLRNRLVLESHTLWKISHSLMYSGQCKNLNFFEIKNKDKEKVSSQDGIYSHVRSCPILAGHSAFPLKHVPKSKDFLGGRWTSFYQPV